MQLPAQPSIQIVPLTRGSVVIAGAEAYACTDADDILATVALLLPPDGSIRPGITPGWPPPEVVPPMAPDAPPPPSDPTTPPTPPQNNPLYQRDNLLRLCDAWAQERISDEQFDEYLATSCPDISLEEAYLTRDSFGPQGAAGSQVAGLLEDTAEVPPESPHGPA